MYFPQYLKYQRRWVVRPKPLPGVVAKQPQSALPSKPEGYVPKYPDEHPESWRKRWNQECILTNYDTAVAYQRKHQNRFEGVGFILHHFNRMEEGLRLVCIDLDHVFVDDDPAKGLLPQARETVEMFKGNCFVEFSRSGKSLHLFLLTRCEPFKNHRVHFEEPLAYDCLCASHVAVTGRVFEEQIAIKEIDFECLSWQPWFENEKATETVYGDVSFQDWWEADDVEIDPECHIARVASTWPEAIKDRGRSDTAMALAVRIMEYGVTGKEAVEYMRLLRTDVEFSDADLRHKVEDGYKKAIESDKFGTRAEDPVCEFGIIEATGEPPKPPEQKKTLIKVYRGDELDALDLKMDWTVKQIMVDIKEDVMFVGGRNKTFKTSVMMDLFVSIVTGLPFLGYFEVVTRKPCLFLTAEIGLVALQSLHRRVCKSKGIKPHRDMMVTTWMPKYKNEKAMDALGELLDEYKPGICAFDPVYFGAAGMDTGDMFDFAEVMQPARERCNFWGALPVFAHHAVKPPQTSKGKEDFSPMGLDHLYGAGFGAFARQWLLLAHSEQMMNGVANLHMTIGGSAAGQGPDLRLRIDEGVADPEDVANRKWDVRVSKGGTFSLDLGSFCIDYLRNIPYATAKDIHSSLVVDVKDASLHSVQMTLDSLKDEDRIIRQGDGYKIAEDDLTPIDISDIL